MSDAAVRAALSGAVPPPEEDLARDVYGVMLQLAESFEREQARERGLLAIANFCQNFAGTDGGLDRGDVARIETKIATALSEGPPRPTEPIRLRAPEKVIEAELMENRLLRERLRVSQVILRAISTAAATLPQDAFSSIFEGLTLDALRVIMESNELLLQEESCRLLLESIDDPRVRGVLDRLATLGATPTAQPTIALSEPEQRAHVERIEGAVLRLFAASHNLTEATGNEQVAYGLGVFNLALTVALAEVEQVTGEKGRDAAALIVSMGKEVRLLREMVKQARATLNLMIPGGGHLQAARRSTLQLLDRLLEEPSTLEQPTFRAAAEEAGFDGRVLGSGICPVHGRVPADHECLIYRPKGVA